MEDKKSTIVVIDESGNEKEAEILRAFTIKKYNKVSLGNTFIFLF